MESPLSAVMAKKTVPLETAAPGELVSDAVEKMHDKGIGALPIVDGDSIVGMFTERDALYRVIHGKLDPSSTPVGEVMTKDPDCVSPDMSVIDAMRMVHERRFRHLPLVDDGNLVGLVSSGDLNRWIVEEQKTEITKLDKDTRSLATKNKALIALVGAFVILIVVGILTT